MSLCSRLEAIEILCTHGGNDSRTLQLESRRDLESIADCVTLFIFPWIIIEVFSYSTQQTKVDWIIRPRVARSHLFHVELHTYGVQTAPYCTVCLARKRREDPFRVRAKPLVCVGVAVWGPRDLGPHSVCLGSYPNTL